MDFFSPARASCSPWVGAGSPSALAWPEEIVILLVFAGGGLGFWFGASRTRRATSESTRAFLILERFADQPAKGNPTDR